MSGVSLSTASVVFSGKGPVTARTAERVRAAATSLGYAGPNPLASSLRAGRCGVVAVVVESPLSMALRDPYALQVLEGLARELGDHALGLLLVAQDPGNPEELIRRMSAMAMDAVLFPLSGIGHNPLVAHLVARGLPIVGAGSPDDPAVVQVSTDEAEAQGLAVRYLLNLGHQRLAHVALPLRPAGTPEWIEPEDVDTSDWREARERARGFLAVAGWGRRRLVAARGRDASHGEEAARMLLDAPTIHRPTAIVAQSDLLAAGALKAAQSLGLRVPDDVSITGFDGIGVPWLDQALTTVVQPGAHKGQLLAQVACRALDGGPIHQETYEVHLRVGATTAPPP